MTVCGHFNAGHQNGAAPNSRRNQGQSTKGEQMYSAPQKRGGPPTTGPPKLGSIKAKERPGYKKQGNLDFLNVPDQGVAGCVLLTEAHLAVTVQTLCKAAQPIMRINYLLSLSICLFLSLFASFCLFLSICLLLSLPLGSRGGGASVRHRLPPRVGRNPNPGPRAHGAGPCTNTWDKMSMSSALMSMISSTSSAKVRTSEQDAPWLA